MKVKAMGLRTALASGSDAELAALLHDCSRPRRRGSPRRSQRSAARRADR
jgi:hypothetical protein